MKENKMLIYLIFFVLGYFVARMMRGNGLSVGGRRGIIESLGHGCMPLNIRTAFSADGRNCYGKSEKDCNKQNCRWHQPPGPRHHTPVAPPLTPPSGCSNCKPIQELKIKCNELGNELGWHDDSK